MTTFAIALNASVAMFGGLMSLFAALRDRGAWASVLAAVASANLGLAVYGAVGA